MKLLLVVALLVAAINAESYIPNSPDPDNPGHCYHKELKLAIKQGETLNPTNVEHCGDLTCQEEGLIRVGQCSRVHGNCPNAKYVPKDYTKPYPECCEHYKCPKK